MGLDNGPKINLRFLIKRADYLRDPASCTQTDLQRATPGDEHLKVFALLGNGRLDYRLDEMFINVVMDRLPILCGVWSRQGDMLKQLMEKGASILLEEDIESDKTVLAVAAERGFEALLSVLIEQRADIEVRGAVMARRRFTLLRRMAMKEWPSILLDNGADIEAQDTLFGQTALLWASEKAIPQL
ncbi:uncharacterized protein P174DRAFT_417049 [Aspergillus novofumigatus IBT 16806]|uniref:Uncharacterized protein n=1 Tax=Aspergillus novofumigatus (strain IBT 16806) TaxID=1392255 RepID=A0A2I1CNZ7_ASPN1|nr:uncharacterized protein P174DRAFT_417049 [Aspergillus novofumigatus IBT 16806]PKX99367.1 hypothetical protein P174DRAFT_417049 [Aspergillus novofumigatus IBT 16806]